MERFIMGSQGPKNWKTLAFILLCSLGLNNVLMAQDTLNQVVVTNYIGGKPYNSDGGRKSSGHEAPLYTIKNGAYVQEGAFIHFPSKGEWGTDLHFCHGDSISGQQGEYVHDVLIPVDRYRYFYADSMLIIRQEMHMGILKVRIRVWEKGVYRYLRRPTLYEMQSGKLEEDHQWYIPTYKTTVVRWSPDK